MTARGLGYFLLPITGVLLVAALFTALAFAAVVRIAFLGLTDATHSATSFAEALLPPRGEITDRNGQPRTSLDVNMSDFQFIGSRQDNEGGQGGQGVGGGNQAGGAAGGQGPGRWPHVHRGSR